MDEVAPILQKIYGVTADEVKVFNKGKTTGFTDDFSSLQNEEFNVSFINGGKITITHEWTDNVELNPDYLCEVTDGVAKYTTANDVIAYPLDTTDGKTFALEGNISDILTTANTQTKGLLQNVYGITDADARAYGSEGYYTIDEDLGIKLYTSKADMSRANKTIQLVFDAATGNIKSANENETTKKVDLVFDQSVPGLEAFGFQETPGSERTVGSIEIDFSTVTNYNTNGSSTIKVVKGDKSSLNTGRAVGEMNGVTISTDGTIYATYSNGQTKLLGQIASAEFANASGLAKEGDNLYASTLNSGEATIQDITTDGGYMNTGVLEMSNVDLSKEFTEMITTQRGFQANSRIITVSDTLLEELTNLKR
ncbi:MAG: flagellar hook-basal body complex protein [Butyrivibrio sp.]|nr:flagellar hook-basal body complex protein [Butyrivibrio sp.]